MFPPPNVLKENNDALDLLSSLLTLQFLLYILLLLIYLKLEFSLLLSNFYILTPFTNFSETISLSPSPSSMPTAS